MSIAPLHEKAQKLSDALSTDFCPWANRYCYWMKNPFWLLILAISGSLLCGIYLNPLVLILTLLLTVVAGIGIVLPWIAMRGISCRVVFDVSRTRVGKPAIVRLSVTNSYPVPVWGLSLIKGFSVDGGFDGNEGVALARVPAWSTVEYSWPFQAVRRGVYPNSSAEMESSFPFGLFRAGRKVDIDGQLIVWPLTVSLEGMPDAPESRQAEDRFSERRVGDFGDMMGTRLFRPGDSLRRVHWAQTARQQTMIVTERQAPSMPSVRVVLDLFKDSYPKSDRGQAVELAVRTAASVCESMHRQHARVELAVGNQLLVAGDGATGFRRIMDTLAEVDVDTFEVPEQGARRGFEVLITTESGRQLGHPHQIIVGNCETRGWLNVANDEALTGELQKHWRSACHAG